MLEKEGQEEEEEEEGTLLPKRKPPDQATPQPLRRPPLPPAQPSRLRLRWFPCGWFIFKNADAVPPPGPHTAATGAAAKPRDPTQRGEGVGVKDGSQPLGRGRPQPRALLWAEPGQSAKVRSLRDGTWRGFSTASVSLACPSCWREKPGGARAARDGTQIFKAPRVTAARFAFG